MEKIWQMPMIAVVSGECDDLHIILRIFLQFVVSLTSIYSMAWWAGWLASTAEAHSEGTG